MNEHAYLLKTYNFPKQVKTKIKKKNKKNTAQTGIELEPTTELSQSLPNIRYQINIMDVCRLWAHIDVN